LEAIYFADGRVKYTGGSIEREFSITDHQGNTRVLFKDVGNGTVKSIENYAYYAMGALLEQESQLNNNYTFSGKELQTELDLGWSDFGTRCLDNWSGKWLGVDILSEAKMGVSPYTYGLGNPIRFSDPSGMIEYDQDGMASVSTDLSGNSRGQSFINKRTNEAKRDAAKKQVSQASDIDKDSKDDTNPDPNEIWAGALSKYFENEAMLQVLESIANDRMLARKFPELAETTHKLASAKGAFRLIQATSESTDGSVTINVGGYDVTFERVSVLKTKYSTYQINQINFGNFTAMIQMGGEAGYRGQVKGVAKSYGDMKVSAPEIAWIFPTKASNRHLGIGQTFLARKFARLVISQSYPKDEEKIMNRLNQVKAFNFQNVKF